MRTSKLDFLYAFCHDARNISPFVFSAMLKIGSE